MTVYISKLQDKLAGAIGADVSASTTAVTARDDAKETVRALSHCLTFSQAFTESTAAAARAGAGQPIPFNGTVVGVRVTNESGSGAGAQGYTDYTEYRLTKWGAAGNGTTTVASLLLATDTITTWTGKAVPLVATAVKVVAGGAIQMSIVKGGAGATAGVGTMTCFIQRDDD